MKNETDEQRIERLTIKKFEEQVLKFKTLSENDRLRTRELQDQVSNLERQLSRKEYELRKINKKLETIGAFAKLFKELQG